MSTDDYGFENQEMNTALLAEASGMDPHEMLRDGRALQKTGGRYSTAIAVQQPRNLELCRKKLMAEAKLAGEAFYYGWGAGQNRIIGPAIGLAMAAARVWGNCAVEPQPIQETDDSWVLCCHFIDLETGFTLGRQFRQSKHWTVHGKFDIERKDDIRFQIGQSKAARNVICNALPKWLIDQAVKEAQLGVREKIEKFVNEKGLPAAVDVVMRGLAKEGVAEEHVLAKCEVPKREGLNVDHVVMLRGDLYALQEGQDRAENLYPTMREKDAAPKTSDLDASLAGSDPGSRDVTSEKEKVAKGKKGRGKAKKRPQAAEDAPETTEPAGGVEPDAKEPATQEGPELGPGEVLGSDADPGEILTPPKQFVDMLKATGRTQRAMEQLKQYWQKRADEYDPPVVEAMMRAVDEQLEKIARDRQDD